MISAQEFIDRLVKKCSLNQSEFDSLIVDEYGDSLPSAEQLAQFLIRSNKLTSYQASVLLGISDGPFLLGNYEIQQEIGSGGMGTVYEAEHRRMERVVALKILDNRTMKTPGAVQRFQQEVKVAAQLNHPNVVAAFDADESDGIHYLVMEFVDGVDLTSFVQRHGPLAEDETIRAILQVAEGLNYAHQHAVIHRDIKPSNLLLCKNGVIKILDMGLARFKSQLDGADQQVTELTGSGVVMGTVDYMAPEQAVSTKNADERSDIYSLGCTLFYLLTGDRPYQGDSAIAKVLKHREGEIPSLRESRPGLSAAIDDLFQRMVAKRPEDRIPSMEALITELRSHANENQIELIQSSPQISLVPHSYSNASNDLSEQATSDWSGTEFANAQTRVDEQDTVNNGGSSNSQAIRNMGIGFGCLVLLVVAVAYFRPFGGDPKPQPPLEPKEAIPQPLSLAEIIERFEPAVVRIDVEHNGATSFGSGFVLKSKGVVVTNYHVIKDGLAAKATFHNGTTVDVEGFLNVDPGNDLVLLHLSDSNAPYPSINLAKKIPRKGEKVVAFGAPEGFSFSATEGIVSGIRNGGEIRRTLLESTGTVHGSALRYDMQAPWIQTTAPISRGNSGGPLLNQFGEVVGINTWVHGGGQNLNFAASAQSIGKLDKADVKEAKAFDQLPVAIAEAQKVAPELPADLVSKAVQDEVFVFDGHSKAVMDVAVSDDGRSIATAGADGKLFIIDLATLKVKTTIEPGDSPFHCTAFTRDGVRLVAGSGEGVKESRNVRVWDRLSGEIKTRIIGRESGTFSVETSPDGLSMVSTHEEGLADFRRFQAVGNSFPLLAHERDGRCYDASFSSDSQYLLTAGADGAMFVWSVKGQLRPLSRMRTDFGKIHTATFSVDGKYVISAGEDKIIRVWENWQEEDQWKEIRQLAGHDGAVTSIDLSVDGKALASCGNDQTIRIWDLETGASKQVFRGHQDSVTRVRFLRSGKFVASSSLDSTVRFWQVRQ